MCKYSLLPVFFLFAVSSKAQLFDTWYLTTSYTYIFDSTYVESQNHFPSALYRMNEHTINFNIATDIYKKMFRAGVHHNQILQRNEINRFNAFISGMFVQYDLYAKQEKYDFNIELNLSTGNYCTCGDELPYLKNGLFYYGFGLAFERQIDGNIFAKLGFTNSFIINRNGLDAYNFMQYVLGIQYRIK